MNIICEVLHLITGLPATH